MRGKETVVILRKALVDRLKPANSVPAQEIEVKGCALIPRASNESGGGWIQRHGYTVYAPAGSDFRAGDRVRARGDEFDVIGEPGDFGKRRGLSIAVTLGRLGSTES